MKPAEPTLPPRLKNHAAGVPSDWACTPIAGQVKNWVYQTTNSFKTSAEAQLLKNEDIARAASGYAKRRTIGETLSATREMVARNADTNYGGH